MNNILEIRSLEGKIATVVKDDFIRNHLSAIYDRALNLKGAILDNDIMLLVIYNFILTTIITTKKPKKIKRL